MVWVTERMDLVGCVGSFSYESEHDLGVMVNEFLESGSYSADSRYSSDSDSSSSDLGHLVEKVLLHKHAVTQYERDLQSTVQTLLLSLDEIDLCLVNEGQCNVNCIRYSLVKLLQDSGYDAAICTSIWPAVDRLPGGDHEYIDVIPNDSQGSERLIIDIDFQSHFEIARAVKSYDALLNTLPTVYVGSSSRLNQFLQVMVDAAKFSLKQNSMPLPPWRSLSYLQAKWFSNYERKYNIDHRNPYVSVCGHKQCFGHLQRLNASIKLENESQRTQQPAINEKKWRVKSKRHKQSMLICS